MLFLKLQLMLMTALADLKTKRDERGATAVEYGLMVALIAVAIAVTVGLLGDQLVILFQGVTTCISGGAC